MYHSVLKSSVSQPQKIELAFSKLVDCHLCGSRPNWRGIEPSPLGLLGESYIEINGENHH